MKIHKMSEMKNGWFIGNFEPTVFKTFDFEICYRNHYEGEIWDQHYHEIATEINYLVSGKMTINNIELNGGDIFTIYPKECAEPKFITDCQLVIVKIPSISNDKYICTGES